MTLYFPLPKFASTLIGVHAASYNADLMALRIPSSVKGDVGEGASS